MRPLSQTAALLATLALACPLAGAADPAPASKQAGSGAATPPKADKTDKADAKPACRVCGGTCGLEPICVCEPGTKKKPKTTYSMRCEPVCVPTPCPWHGGEGGRHALSCAGGPCSGGCGGATVRTKKSLLKTIKEEEVDMVTRKIEHVCRHCSGRETASSCTSCTDPGPTRSWWPWAWLLAR